MVGATAWDDSVMYSNLFQIAGRGIIGWALLINEPIRKNFSFAL
jgi:hypothetical protein